MWRRIGRGLEWTFGFALLSLPAVVLGNLLIWAWSRGAYPEATPPIRLKPGLPQRVGQPVQAPGA